RTVDDGSLLAVELEPLGLHARVEAAVADHHSRLDELLVERLELGHHLGRRGGRDVVLLGQNQYSHLLSPCSQLDTEARNLTQASNDTGRFRHARGRGEAAIWARMVDSGHVERAIWAHLATSGRPTG